MFSQIAFDNIKQLFTAKYLHMDNIMNMHSACRACLRSSEEGASIFDVHQHDLKFSEMLTGCSGVLVSMEDSYPKNICPSCILELSNVWKFVKMCRSSDDSLHKHYGESQHQKIFTEIESIENLKLEIKDEYNSQSIKTEFSSDNNMEDSDPDYRVEEEVDVKRVLRAMANTNKSTGRKKPTNKSKKAHKTGASFSCLFCSYVTETSGRLKKHWMRNHPGANEFPCRSCSKIFKRKSDLVVHARTHSGERPFACPHCPRRFAQSGTLSEHRRRHTGETPFACPLCPRLFASRSSFWRHRRVHSGERPYACERCGATFSHASTLKHHANHVHSAERPHCCDHCGRSTKSVYAMRQHMLTHGEKAFVCEHCGKKFSLKSNLESHVRKMHSAAAGRCTLCRKDTSNLQEHMLMHSGLTPYTCPVCARSFRLKNSLSFHVALHDNAHKYACAEKDCGKAFPKRNMLDFHTRKVHSNETPHICQYCSKGYFRTSDLSRHINSQHPDESSLTK